MNRLERWIGDWIELSEAVANIITFEQFSFYWSMNYYCWHGKRAALKAQQEQEK